LRTFPDSPVRILLADDHPVFRMGMRNVLERQDDVIVAGEAGCPLELTDWLHAHPCDLLVTDFMMPAPHQHDGLRLLDYIQRYWPALPVLVVTALTNPGLLRLIVGTGAKGLIGKDSLVDELPMAIAQVRRRRCFMSSAIVAALQPGKAGATRQGDSPVAGPHEPLSPREQEVTRLFASGLSVGEIATRISRSKQTVSAQKVAAMRKLGVPSDAALLIYLREHPPCQSFTGHGQDARETARHVPGPALRQ
jgi:two-component system capsular synthesis response regulator RcsB